MEYEVMLKYICAKIYTSQSTKKQKNTQEMIEMILIFMKFVVFTKHCDCT